MRVRRRVLWRSLRARVFDLSVEPVREIQSARGLAHSKTLRRANLLQFAPGVDGVEGFAFAAESFIVMKVHAAGHVQRISHGGAEAVRAAAECPVRLGGIDG